MNTWLAHFDAGATFEARAFNRGQGGLQLAPAVRARGCAPLGNKRVPIRYLRKWTGLTGKEIPVISLK